MFICGEILYKLPPLGLRLLRVQEQLQLRVIDSVTSLVRHYVRGPSRNASPACTGDHTARHLAPNCLGGARGHAEQLGGVRGNVKALLHLSGRKQVRA